MKRDQIKKGRMIFETSTVFKKMIHGSALEIHNFEASAVSTK